MIRTPARGLAAAALAVLAPPLAAQMPVTIGGGVGFASAYVDRGVVLVHGPVLQPGVGAVMGVAGGTVTIGVRAVAETTTPDSLHFGLADPLLKRPNLVEVRPALTLSQPFLEGAMRIDVTGAYRLFQNTAGTTSTANTGSVATRVAFPTIPLSPAVGVSYEFGAITGPMLEAEVLQVVTLTPGIGVALGARSGVAVGRRVRGDVVAFALHARDGFAYADFVAALPLTIVGAEIRPSFTATYARERFIGEGKTRRGLGWFGTFGTSVTLTKHPKPKPKPPARRR